MVRFVDYKKAKPNLEVNGWLNLINLLSHTHKINLFFPISIIYGWAFTVDLF